MNVNGKSILTIDKINLGITVFEIFILGDTFISGKVLRRRASGAIKIRFPTVYPTIYLKNENSGYGCTSISILSQIRVLQDA